MHTKQTKDKGDKAKCTDFGSTFKGFQEMSGMMGKCCAGQGGTTDCSAMMDEMMKGMMEKCCGPKLHDRNSQGQNEFF